MQFCVLLLTKPRSPWNRSQPAIEHLGFSGLAQNLNSISLPHSTFPHSSNQQQHYIKISNVPCNVHLVQYFHLINRERTGNAQSGSSTYLLQDVQSGSMTKQLFIFAGINDRCQRRSCSSRFSEMFRNFTSHFRSRLNYGIAISTEQLSPGYKEKTMVRSIRGKISKCSF